MLSIQFKSPDNLLFSPLFNSVFTSGISSFLTKLDLPDPLTPVITVKHPKAILTLGISRLLE